MKKINLTHVKEFTCPKKLFIPKFTILEGLNGTGKSSFLKKIMPQLKRQFGLFGVGVNIYSSFYEFFKERERIELHGLTIFKNPEIFLHPKSIAEYTQKLISIKKNNFIIETHSDFIVKRLMINIMQKNIKAEDVQILNFNRNLDNGKQEYTISTINLDACGNIINAPKNYNNWFLKETERALGFNKTIK